MKVKLAFGILILACASVAAGTSCPVKASESPVILNTFSLSQGPKCPDNVIRSKAKWEFSAMENSFSEDSDDLNKLNSRGHLLIEQAELMPATLANMNNFPLSKSEFKNCISIDYRNTIYSAFPHSLPGRSITAFIRNGILRF